MSEARAQSAANYSRILRTPAIREERVSDGRWSYASGILGLLVEEFDRAIRHQTGAVVLDDRHQNELQQALGLLDALAAVRSNNSNGRHPALTDAQARRLEPGQQLVNRLNRHPLRFVELSPDGTVHAVDQTTGLPVAVDVHECEAAS